MKLPFRRREDCLAVEVNHKKIRWAYASRSAKGKVVSYGESDLGGMNVMELKSALPAKPSRVVLVIGRDEVIVKTLKLPSSHPKEIENLMAFKLPQEIPYGMAEIVYDFEVIRTRPDGFADTHVIWMLRKNVEEKLKFLENLGFEADDVLPSSYGLLGFYQRQREKSPDLPAQTALLRLAPAEAEFLVTDGEKVLFSHAAKKGTDIPGAGKDAFLRELKGYLDAYEKESQTKVEHLRVTGLYDVFAAVKESLAMVFACPFFYLGETKGSTFSGEHLAGTCLTQEVGRVGLMPAELKHRRTEARENESARRSLVWMAACAALTLVALAMNLVSLEAKSKRLAAELGKIHPESKKILEIAREMEFIEQLDMKKTVPLAFLALMSSIVPPEVTLTQLDYDEAEGFRIRGLGETHQVIVDLMKSIKTFPETGKADFDFSRRKVQEGREYFDFQISATIDWDKKRTG